MKPKYPNIEVTLTDTDGNAFSILSRVRAAMKKANIPQEEIKQFTEEATKGDYGFLIATCMKYVNIE